MDLAYDSKVGRGAFADVWLATDSLGRSVAVKFFNDTNPSQAERNALDHAKALARVHHSAVVQVLSLERQPHPDTNTECTCIIMEFVKGPNLSLHKSNLSVEHGRAILLDVGGAINAIHAAGLVHGDLHDGNIVVTNNGAKVIDILYTHSLADVGTRTSARTREDDLRDLAVLFRQVLTKCGYTGRALEEAYFRARDAPASVSSVQQPFLSLLEGSTEPETAASVPDASLGAGRGEQQGTGASPTPAPTDAVRQQVLALVTSLQSGASSLASCVADALALSSLLSDSELHSFCADELRGYEGRFASISTAESSLPRKDDHRLIQAYLSVGAEINIDYFGSGHNAIEWMRDRPTEFRPVKLLLGKPVNQLERDAHGSAKALLSISGPAKDFLPDLQNPELKIYFYARGDAAQLVVDRIRSILTTKLLSHLSGPSPLVNRLAPLATFPGADLSVRLPYKCRYGTYLLGLDLGSVPVTDTFETTWRSLFTSLAPILEKQASRQVLKDGLTKHVALVQKPRLEAGMTVEKKTWFQFEVDDSDVQMIITRFLQSGLIAPTTDVDSSDSGPWTLTSQGRAIRDAETRPTR